MITDLRVSKAVVEMKRKHKETIEVDIMNKSPQD